MKKTREDYNKDMKEYYKKHKKRINRQNRENYFNPEKHDKYKAAALKRYYDNQEKRKAYQREYYKKVIKCAND